MPADKKVSRPDKTAIKKYRTAHPAEEKARVVRQAWALAVRLGMERSRVNKSELARRLGVTHRTIGLWLTGAVSWDIGYLTLALEAVGSTGPTTPT